MPIDLQPLQGLPSRLLSQTITGRTFKSLWILYQSIFISFDFATISNYLLKLFMKALTSLCAFCALAIIHFVMVTGLDLNLGKYLNVPAPNQMVMVPVWQGV